MRDYHADYIEIVRDSSGSIDYEYYRTRAHQQQGDIIFKLFDSLVKRKIFSFFSGSEKGSNEQKRAHSV